MSKQAALLCITNMRIPVTIFFQARFLVQSILLIIVFISFSCWFGSSYKDRRIYKTFHAGEGVVEWYSYTSAVSDSPFYVTIEHAGKFDTVCITTNITDIDSINSNTIRLLFCGSPKKYDEKIDIPEKVKHWNIIIDTTCSIILQ